MVIGWVEGMDYDDQVIKLQAGDRLYIYSDGVPEAMEMVRELVKGHEAVARTARAAFGATDKASDESSADLLT